MAYETVTTILIGCLFSLVVIGFVYVYLTRRRAFEGRPSRRSRTPDASDDAGGALRRRIGPVPIVPAGI